VTHGASVPLTVPSTRSAPVKIAVAIYDAPTEYSRNASIRRAGTGAL
jgi:hypothetical protein